MKTTVAVTPAVAVLACDYCDVELRPTGHAVCLKCHRSAIQDAEFDARVEEAKEHHEPAGKTIREWAARRHLMGQISRDVRTELELCAEDIEVGHG